jgi:flagellar biosynthesis protein FliP
MAMAAGLMFAGVAHAQDPTLGAAIEEVIQGSDPGQAAASVRLLVLLTTLSMLPAMLLVMTPFTRFIIVFSLLRQALGLQQSPPNQILIGLSLVLSILVMQPTLTSVYDTALNPYMDGQLSTTEAYELGIEPMRTFMLRNLERDDLATAMKLAKMSRPDSLADVPTAVVTTAFLLSELKIAFIIAVKVYIPFLVVDIIIASSLLGMGMMMLPPVVISLPFKLMVFVLMDGWGLLVTGLVGGIR